MKKVFTLLLLGLIAFTSVVYAKDEMDTTTEARGKVLFGDNAKAIERQIFKTMTPPKVTRKVKGWGFKGKNFKLDVKDKADGGFEYIENGKKLGIKSTGMAWDGVKTKLKAENVTGDFAGNEIKYVGALGTGINIKIIQENWRVQKIIEIESLASLGVIPVGAEYLEFSFDITGDFVLPEGVVSDRVSFGENSFINPVRCWDSSEPIDGEVDKNLAVGEISGKTVTKKIPVAWLKTASFPVSTDLTITYGSENVFNSALTNYISVSALDSTHFVVAYKDAGNSNYGTAIVGVISGTTISSYGAENVFNSALTNYISVSALDSTHFVIAFMNGIDADNAGTAIIGLVSGTTISSYGSPNIFDSSTSVYCSVSALDSTHFVVCYKDLFNSGGNGTAIVGLTSGTAISSYGSQSVFNAGSTNYISVSALDSTHFVVAYQDDVGDDYGGAKVGLTNGGTTISSFGSEKIFNSGITIYINTSIINSTHFVVIYRDGSNFDYGTAIIGLTSGTTISSYGSEAVFVGRSVLRSEVAILDSTHFVVVARAGDDGWVGSAFIGTFAGTTISSFSASETFNNATTYYTSVAMLDSTHFVVTYKDNGNSEYGTAIVGTSVSPGYANKVNGVASPAFVNGVAGASIATVNGA